MRTRSYAVVVALATASVAVDGDVRGEAEGVEPTESDQLVDVVVLGDQDVAVTGCPPVELGMAALPTLWGRCSLAVSRRLVNQNVLPTPGSLDTPISPPRAFTSWWRDRQPEPGAAEGPGRGGVRLAERLEQAAEVAADADARVGDLGVEDDARVGSRPVRRGW